jgi:hypothetical protein
MNMKHVFPACHGACQQGRKLCPNPEACQQDDDGKFSTISCLIVWVFGSLAAWAAIVALGMSL